MDPSPSALNVKLEAFEGPLDLLLHLIRTHELDIYDIPIAFITAEYLRFIREREQNDLKIPGDFIVLAATLMYIKSKMMLPVDEREEDEPEEDPREELVRMILEYQKYKEAAGWLGEKLDERKGIYARPEGVLPAPVIEQQKLVDASVDELLQAWDRILQRVSDNFVIEIKRPEVSVSQKIGDLTDRIQEGPIPFEELFVAGKPLVEWIAIFLAILEMARLGLIRVVQEKPGAALEIHPSSPEEQDAMAEGEGAMAKDQDAMPKES